MVATRKVPLVPPPPTSRTNTSQATPRTAKSKMQAIPNVQGTLGGEDSRAGSSNGSGNSKNGKGNSNDVKSGKAFGDFLVYLLLAYLSIYAVSVCPTDVNHQSAVCHGLIKYRELILEPYVFPIFHRALAHPSIAPHVKRVKPHVDTAVRIGKPIVRRTRVVWNSRIMPQWNKRVVPQWQKHVVPQWNKHIAPQLRRVDQVFEPYRFRIKHHYSHYSKRITPHWRTAKTNLRRWQRQAQPYVILAVTKTHRGYQAAKPYAIPIWKHIQAGVKQLLLFVREQRVLFVDPHVARIWEKVKELSSGKPREGGTVREEAADPRTVKTAIRVTDEQAAPPPTSPSSVIPSETERMASVVNGSSAMTPTIAPEPSAVVTEFSVVAMESPLIASTIEPEDIASPSSILESTSPTTVSSTIAYSHSEEVIPAPQITGPSLITNEPAPTLPVAADEIDIDIDLDEFARELGLDETDTIEQVNETIVPPPVETESEAEKAERKRLKEIKIAETRAEIEGRHLKWEADLRDLIKVKKKSLRKELVAIRKSAAVELKEHKEIRATMAGLAVESEKYLKGAEAYLKALKLESKQNAAKITLWDKLINKIDTKFRNRLNELDDTVNGWYTNVLDQEAQEVQLVAADVKELAGNAQSDLGIDYSWLGDVTYDDWQRYHDLLRASDNFTELATSIQKGTHSSPPINPVVDVLEELESELENIVDGFEIRLRRLQHDGADILSVQVNDVDVTASTSKPEFSILPVPKDEVDREGAAGDIPPVVIGRSKEEIVDAFSRAGEGTEILSPQGVKTESEEIVRNLAPEVPVAAGRATPVPAANHVEL